MSELTKVYRVYCFDIERGTVSAEFLKAASDEDAVAKAREAGFGSKCEIWDGKRLVAQLEEAAPKPGFEHLGRGIDPCESEALCNNARP